MVALADAARRIGMVAGLAVGLGSTSGCSSLLSYADELVDSDTGRTVLVRAPANVSGMLGFVVGLPISLLATPATGTIYLLRPDDQPADGTLFLFPSFVLWKAGALLVAPIDVLEFALWRAWQPLPPLSEEERRRLEERLDRETRRVYPVQPIFPVGAWETSGS